MPPVPALRWKRKVCFINCCFKVNSIKQILWYKHIFVCSINFILQLSILSIADFLTAILSITFRQKIVVFCFIFQAGLLDGLAEVIVTSDTFISVRATVLLGQLLHLSHLFLPPQICSVMPALPSLMSQASAGRPQALAAIAALRRLHSMLEARPATSSLFLDHIVQYCSGAFKERDEDTTKSKKEKDNASMVKPKLDLHKESIDYLDESDYENEPKRHSVGSRADLPVRNVSALPKSKSMSSRTSAAVSKVTKTAKFLNFRRDSHSLIKSTLVTQSDDGKKWDWEIIRAILKVSFNYARVSVN